MKIFFTIFIVAILLTGCATRNAFSKLGMSEQQEKAVENIRNGKLSFENEVGGVFSAMYLNNIFPEIDKKTLKFYISIYLKSKSDDLNITLDNYAPLEIEELPKQNDFSHLIAIKSEWSKNYLVSFENNESSNSATLIIESGQFSSGQLSYSKDLR